MTESTISSAGLDERRRRTLFRAWHRGMREMDIIYGKFSDSEITKLSDAELDQFDLRCIEQPLPAHALDEHAALARRIATPICLDESLTSIEITERAIEIGACTVVCVKAPRLGSWLGAAALLDRCQHLGVDAWVGGMLDTGIGRLANIALASHHGATLPGDISATDRFFTEDICPPVRVEGGPGTGTVTVLDHAIGSVVDLDEVIRLTTRVELIRR